MRNLIVTLCLTLAVLLGSTGDVWSVEPNEHQYCLSGTKHSHYAIRGVCSSAYETGAYATALSEWKPQAEQGNGYAQHNLGQIYIRGHGVPQDDKTAVKWWKLAAEQGHAKAQNNLRRLTTEQGSNRKTSSSGGYRDWSTAKQAGYIFGRFENCIQYAGLFMESSIGKKLSALSQHYSGNSQYEVGLRNIEIVGADICTNCTELCTKYEVWLKRSLDEHISKFDNDSTQSAIEKCRSFGRKWDYTEDICLADTAETATPSSDNKSSTLEATERKCTELEFTKGTEKHGDCDMKLYK